MSYFIRQEKSKEYILEDNEVRLGSLTFKSWNSSNAIAKISNQELKFTKKGFWNPEYLLLKMIRCWVRLPLIGKADS